VTIIVMIVLIGQALVEDRGNTSTLARALREEALGIKFECVRMISMESDTREVLREQVRTLHHNNIITG
jgi:hypothetical protein